MTRVWFLLTFFFEIIFLHMQLRLTDNLFYTVNGALLILVFLLVRTLFVPISVSIYAAQYHHWDLLRALGSMKWICHTCNLMQFSLQLYWFVLLLRLAVGVVRGWSQMGAESLQQQDGVKRGRDPVPSDSATKKYE